MYDWDKVKKSVELFLEGIGEDPNREGLLDTPTRVADMYAKILNGYDENVGQHLCTFKINSNNMVVIRNIVYHSFCEHHCLPFFGTISVAYKPNGCVIGLSKVVRIARIFAKRLQIQERLTDQIADCLYRNLKPKGLIVKLTGSHTCLSLRGVRAPGVVTDTVTVRGEINEKDEHMFHEAIKESNQVFKY